jgi:hypothetical protein
MSALENLRNRLIDRILATRNEKLLQAIENIFDSTQNEELVKFSSEQIEMLSMSEDDIKDGNIISESELDKSDDKWLQ